MSRISTRLVSPKFLLASNSSSDVRVRSPKVLMPIFCRQLRLRTDNSKSLTEMFSTWFSRSLRFWASSS